MEEFNLETDEFLQSLIATGHATKNLDGTYRLSPELRSLVIQMLNERMELFKKIFPERIN